MDRKTVQGLGDGFVGELHRLGDRLSLDKLRGHGAGGDGAAAAKGLKSYIHNDVIFDFQVDLHNIAAFGVAYFAHAAGVFHGTHIPGIAEMVHYLFAVKSHKIHLI